MRVQAAPRRSNTMGTIKPGHYRGEDSFDRTEGREISSHPNDGPTQGRCPHCGGTHRLMEPCPDAPTPWELVAGWFEGERTPSHYLAIVGMTVLPLLVGF